MKWEFLKGIPRTVFNSGTRAKTIIQVQGVDGTVRSFSVIIDAKEGIIPCRLLKEERRPKKILGKVKTNQSQQNT